MIKNNLLYAKRIFIVYIVVLILAVLSYLLFLNDSSVVYLKILLGYIIVCPLLLNGILGLSINVMFTDWGIREKESKFQSWFSIIAGIVILILLIII